MGQSENKCLTLRSGIFKCHHGGAFLDQVTQLPEKSRNRYNRCSSTHMLACSGEVKFGLQPNSEPSRFFSRSSGCYLFYLPLPGARPDLRSFLCNLSLFFTPPWP